MVAYIVPCHEQTTKAAFQPVFLHGCESSREEGILASHDTSISILSDRDANCYVYVEDIVSVSGVPIRLPGDGVCMVENGHFISLIHGTATAADSSSCASILPDSDGRPGCAVLLVWRVDNAEGVKWLAASVDTPLPTGYYWRNAPSLKAYISPASNASIETRLSLMACICSTSDSQNVCLAKIDLVDTEYVDITEIVERADDGECLHIADILEAVGETTKLDVRTRVLRMSGKVQEILCSTARGVVGVLAASERRLAQMIATAEGNSSGLAESVVIVDVEDDEDDDDDDGSEGGNDSDDPDEDDTEVVGGGLDMSL